jgi:membrane protease YdiL (CAAX protease family)
MPVIPFVLLAIFAAALARLVYKDGDEYRRFKAQTDTHGRQRFYATWLAKSFAVFGVGSVASLAITGYLPALIQMPAPFAQLSDSLQPVIDLHHVDGDFFLGFGGSLAAGLIVAWLILRYRAKRRTPQDGPPKVIMVGDIQPLLPRNAAERWWAAFLSINAGMSEELFFRLALPLLIVLVTGNVIVAFAAATIVFGLMHLYQGWVGVVMTGLVGAVMSAIYLASGSIWIVATLHAVMDLNGLILMPWIAQRSMRKA